MVLGYPRSVRGLFSVSVGWGAALAGGSPPRPGRRACFAYERAARDRYCYTRSMWCCMVRIALCHACRRQKKEQALRAGRLLRGGAHATWAWVRNLPARFFCRSAPRARSVLPHTTDVAVPGPHCVVPRLSPAKEGAGGSRRPAPTKRGRMQRGCGCATCLPDSFVGARLARDRYCDTRRMLCCMVRIALCHVCRYQAGSYGRHVRCLVPGMAMRALARCFSPFGR